MSEQSRTRDEKRVFRLDAARSVVGAATTAGAPPSTGQDTATAPTRHHPRIAAVDALRGFSMFWILGADGMAWSLRQMSEGKGALASAFGNFLGTQFEHVAWEGFRFYDFIFPLFVFVTGVSIVLSLPGLVERNGKGTAYRRIVRRSLLLFVLGLLYYGGVSSLWPDIRLLGVLQRIAICYLAVSLLFLNLRAGGLAVVLAILLVGYWALMTFVPVPGIGAGSFAPNANLANWIDAHYLPGRLWDGTYDPEGLLSTIPAIGTCLLGAFAGMLLINGSVAPQRKSLYLVVAGAAAVAAGYLWGLQFPIVKAIWTSSFVLVAGGYGAMLLGAMHQIIDVWQRRVWALPFVWIGANAITLYFLNGILNFQLVATRFVGGNVGAFLDRSVTPGTGRFATYALGLLMAIALARFLYRHKIFLRV